MSKWKEIRRHDAGDYMFDVLWEVEHIPATSTAPAEYSINYKKIVAVYGLLGKELELSQVPNDVIEKFLNNKMDYDDAFDVTPEGYNEPDNE